MLKTKDIKVIEVTAWDDLVCRTYGKPYMFQQQDGCQERGTFKFKVPLDPFLVEEEEEFMNDSIPEIVNHSTMGVKFNVWLQRDPKELVEGSRSSTSLWWERNFYPSIYTVIDDLYKKELIEEGEYLINIDW